MNAEEILKTAEKIHDRWKLAWLFVATPDGFYFDSCSNVIEKKTIMPLNASWVNAELQRKYLEIMNKFQTD